MKTWFCSLVLVVVAHAAVSVAAEPKPHPCATLETALPHGVKLLDEKRYKDFLTAFVHPDDIAALPPGQTLDDITASFGEGEKAVVLLAVFRSILGAKPTLSEEGTVATYAVPVKEAPRDEIQFTLRDGRWYIRN